MGNQFVIKIAFHPDFASLNKETVNIADSLDKALSILNKKLSIYKCNRKSRRKLKPQICLLTWLSK